MLTGTSLPLVARLTETPSVLVTLSVLLSEAALSSVLRNGQRCSRLVCLYFLLCQQNIVFVFMICTTSVCWLFVTGGKAFGLLKTQQEEKLNSINEVS